MILLEAPIANSVVIEVMEGRTAPRVNGGAVGDAAFLICEGFAAIWARKMLFRGGRIWDKRAKRVDAEGVKNVEAILEMPGSIRGDVLSPNFKTERALDKRAPFA